MVTLAEVLVYRGINSTMGGCSWQADEHKRLKYTEKAAKAEQCGCCNHSLAYRHPEDLYSHQQGSCRAWGFTVGPSEAAEQGCN